MSTRLDNLLSEHSYVLIDTRARLQIGLTRTIRCGEYTVISAGRSPNIQCTLTVLAKPTKSREPAPSNTPLEPAPSNTPLERAPSNTPLEPATSNTL